MRGFLRHIFSNGARQKTCWQCYWCQVVETNSHKIPTHCFKVLVFGSYVLVSCWLFLSHSTCWTDDFFPFLNDDPRVGISHYKLNFFNNSMRNLETFCPVIYFSTFSFFFSLVFSIKFCSVTFVLETSLTAWFIDGQNQKNHHRSHSFLVSCLFVYIFFNWSWLLLRI